MSLYEPVKEKEEIYKVLIENINTGIFISTPEGKFLHANHAIAKMAGYDSVEEFINIPAQKLYAYSKDREKIIKELSEKGYVEHIEMESVKEDGTLYWISLSAVILKDSKGQQMILGTVADVTDRKRVEEALKKSEYEKSLILNSTQEMFACYDTELKIMWANKASGDSVGKKAEELTGFHCYEVWHESKSPCPDCPVLKARDTKKPEEKEMVTPDGRIWIVRGYPVLNEKDEVVALVEFGQDISKSRKSEYALRESEERYRELFERINTCVAVYEAVDEGADFIIKEFNAAAERAEKISGKDITGKRVTEVFPGVVEFGILDVFRRVYHSGVSKYHPVSLYRDNRIEGWRDNFVYRLPSGEVVAVYEDVTEKKQAEEALKESEERFRALFEQVPVGVAQIETETGRFIRVNQKYCHITGLTQDELLSETFMNITHPDDIEAYLQNMKRLIAGDIENFSMEKRYVRRDGTVVWVNLTVSPMWKKDEIPDYHIAVVEDITERKKIEEKLFEAQKMDSIGNLAGGVAHDFNNMLGGMMGYATLLLMDEEDPQKITFLEGIVNSARRAGELTQKLLAFGRRGKNIVEPININHIVKEVSGIVERSIDKSIELKIELSENIYSIDGDPSQMNQVIMNLCMNAKEAMPYGGKIFVKTENRTLTEDLCSVYPELKAGEYVVLTVKDTGCGMTEDVRKRIFEPFFTTKKDGAIKGTGLGLATVYGIVKNHNGTVDLHTEPGRGTTFIVYLPGGSKRKEIEERPENRIDEDYGTILIIDDEELFRGMLKAMLQRYGYSVLTACDGKEGIHIYKERYSEIRGVIIDMKMPVMGGKDAFLEMKKINPHIRALLCTGYGHNEEAQEILDLGVKDLLPKPCGSRELSEKLKKLFM